MNPIIRRMIQLLGLILIQAIILFLSAWSLSWLEGWLYIGIYAFLIIMASLIMIPTGKKEVIAERSMIKEDAKKWDKCLTGIMMIPSLGMLVVAGMDERFHWQPDFGTKVQIVGGVLYVLGYLVVLWAMYTNQFFSSVVRIQKERGHVAITGGPYHFVRHPGYIGMMFSFIGIVFLLDSVWSLIVFVLYAIVVIIRTKLEDDTLKGELPGYREYATQTRYRLIPGVW